MSDNPELSLDAFIEVLKEKARFNWEASTVIYLNRLKDEIVTLKSELKQKEAQLSEFQKGIPMEKADKEKTYFNLESRSYPIRVVFWSEHDKQWLAQQSECDVKFTGSRVYPLPTAVKEDA